MPKYLVHAGYTPEGVQGLLSDGGSSRREAAIAACESLGGTVEAFYFAFGAPVRGGGRSFERMGEHHGSIIRVSKDGSRLERYATGGSPARS